MTELVLKAVRVVLAFTRAVAGLCLLVSVGINFANIVGRYLFGVSITWAEEIMLFLMVGCVFTGCCAVAWEGRQIRMDVIVNLLPAKVRDAVALVSELVMIAAALAVAVFAWPVIRQLAEFDERSQAAEFPLFVPQGLVPLGYMLMAVLVALRLVIGARRARSPAPTPHT
jgi:TRAP-type C4-dicarboxylate transport system permease small subunit